MNFSQAWDAGFRAILIYVGVVFFWLGLIERHFASQAVSVALMNVVGLFAAAAFFVGAWNRARKERVRVEAEVRALLEEQV